MMTRVVYETHPAKTSELRLAFRVTTLAVAGLMPFYVRIDCGINRKPV